MSYEDAIAALAAQASSGSVQRHHPANIRESAQARDSAALLTPEVLTEGYGDLVPFTEFPQFDWPEASGTARGAGYVPYTTINDRADGKFSPVFETEQELAAIRGMSRRLMAMSPYMPAAINSLRTYTLGNGPTVSAVPKDKKDTAAAEGAKLLDFVLARVIDQVGLAPLLEELHDRSREEGEGLNVLHCHGGDCLTTEIVEMDGLTEPQVSAGLIDWIRDEFGIDCDAFVPSWKFGILTGKRTTDTPLGYHVVYDGGGADFEFYPASRVVHVKRNVPRNVKRGISDWYQEFDDLRNEAKVARNIGVNTALQAAIAWIEEYAAGATASQAQSTTPTDVLSKVPTGIGQGGGTRNQRATHYGPGTIVRTSAGRQYKPGPMGSERNGNFEIAIQLLLRRIGIRNALPEYMISGDSSNGNFASTVVAESPFVKAREADQEFMRRIAVQLLWKAAALIWTATTGKSMELFEHVKACCEIKVDFPAVQTRDPLALAQRLKIESEMGWVSDQTAMSELGRDPEQEKSQGAKKLQPPGGGPFGGMFGGGGAGGPGPDDGGNGPGGSPSGPAPMRALPGPKEQLQESVLLERFNESDHPRDDNGRFISSQKLIAAASNPQAAANLRSRVTNPEERKKLDRFIKNPGEAEKSRASDPRLLKDSYSEFKAPSWSGWKNNRNRLSFSVGEHVDEKGITRSTPYESQLTTLKGDYVDFDRSVPKDRLAMSIEKSMGEPAKEFSFINIRTGYGEENNAFGITGSGNASEVIRKVTAHFLKALDAYEPKVVLFTAKESSRAKLYTKIASDVSKYAGYRAFQIPGTDGNPTTYAVVRDDSVPQFEQLAKKSKVAASRISESVSTFDDDDLEQLQESFDESKHPRGDNGRFISGARLAAAKKDPVKAAELRKEVTDPEQRKKLDAVIGAEPKSGEKPGRVVFHATDKASAKDLETSGINPESLNRRDSGFFGGGFYASHEPQDMYGKSIVAVHLKPDAKVLDVGDLNPKEPPPWHREFIASLENRIKQRRPDIDPAKLKTEIDAVTPGSKTFSHLEYNQEVGRFARSEGYDAVGFANGQETVVLNPSAVEKIKHVGGLEKAKGYAAAIGNAAKTAASALGTAAALAKLDALPAGDIPQKRIPPNRDFESDASFEARGRSSDAEDAESNGHKAFIVKTVDPSKLTSPQEFVDHDKLQKLITTGPPSRQQWMRDTPHEELPIVVQQDGKDYIVDGNHRSLWAGMYGEPLKVRYLPEDWKSPEEGGGPSLLQKVVGGAVATGKAVASIPGKVAHAIDDMGTASVENAAKVEKAIHGTGADNLGLKANAILKDYRDEHTPKTPTNQPRAKAGGEEGPNGEWYQGGAFIATTDMPKKIRQKIDGMAKGKVELETGKWEQPKPGEMSIFAKMAGTVMNPRNGEINHQYLNYIKATPQEAATYERLAKDFMAGRRWVPVTEAPELAGIKDAALLVAANQPIPGVLLSKLPSEWKTHLAKYTPKGTVTESTLRAALTGALESVETTDEARAVLESMCLPELAIDPNHEQEKPTT